MQPGHDFAKERRRHVHDRDVDSREVVRGGVRTAEIERDAVRLGVALGRVEGGGIVVDRHDRVEAEPGRGDRKNARAAADVDEASALDLEQQPEAESRRGMTAGAERTTRIDDDCGGVKHFARQSFFSPANRSRAAS